MKDFLRRAGWLTLAIVFLGTGLGIGVYAFWVNTRRDQSPPTNQSATSEKKMDNFTPVATVEKLETIDLKAGEGAEVKPESTVTVHYVGALASTGDVFESSKDFGQPATFKLSEVIKGWTDGLPGMKVGGERRLVIPAALAYGPNSPSPKIPPNSSLVFDITLLDAK